MILQSKTCIISYCIDDAKCSVGFEHFCKMQISQIDKPFTFEIETFAGRKAYFAASRYDFFLLLIIRDDERYRWIREIENNSFSSMKQTIESLESGLRSMAIDEVFD